MRIGLAQINVTVGDLPGNLAMVREWMSRADRDGLDLLVFPELVLSGYPPEDLLFRPAFLEACRAALDDVVASAGGCTVVVGFPEQQSAGRVFNSAAVVRDGHLVGVVRKRHLPNYGVFDEARYFVPGASSRLFKQGETTFGISICEDVWTPRGPVAEQAEAGCDLLVNISASPYHRRKPADRERMLSTRAADHVTPIAFCNLVGGQDELVFDGGSAVFDGAGRLVARAPLFEPALVVAELETEALEATRLRAVGSRRHRSAVATSESEVERVTIESADERTASGPLEALVVPLPDPVSETYAALVRGTRDYVRKNGFENVLVGLSGGIDSTLVACVAADALGSAAVTGVSMPSMYSSAHSRDDAAELAGNLGIRYWSVPIGNLFDLYLDELTPVYRDADPTIGDRPDLTIAEENLQARIRGTLLMTLSNRFGSMVLTTGNKSEVSVGYATLYGDMVGGLSVLKDVPKQLVYELCRHRNTRSADIPANVLDKAPSAELRPDQKDTDSLPDYATLDAILEAYVERDTGIEEIVRRGFSRDLVCRTLRQVDRAEFKRRQAAPGLRVTHRAFGRDRRYPITNRFEHS